MRSLLVGLFVLASIAVEGVASAPAAAQEMEAPYSDEEIVRGFVLTVFGAEVENAANSNTASIVKKFTGPVRYRLVSTAAEDWRPLVRNFLRSLSHAVRNLVLLEARHANEAVDLTIYLVDRADYAATIRNTVWRGVDTGFMEGNACSAIITARRSGIQRSNIYLVVDEGFSRLSHCMVEEVAQSLGPANDSPLLPESIFNDQSSLNAFGVFDWFILNMLYDPRIRPGMTEEAVRPVLPALIEDVRKRVPDIGDRNDMFHGRMITR